MSKNDELKAKTGMVQDEGSGGSRSVQGMDAAGSGNVSGLDDEERSEGGGSVNEGGLSEGERSVPERGGDNGGNEGEERVGEEELRLSRNRDEVVGKGKGKVKFDKEKHPLEKSGHWFRKDHLKLYKIHAALKGCSRQELINKALEYYKVNVLQKSEAQKLKEAGQEELGI